MNRVELIVTDLDGTLLDARGRIPDANADAILEAADAGITIAVATGRPLRWLACLTPIIAAQPIVIVSNGASVYDLRAARVLTRTPLAHRNIAAIVDDLRRAIPDLAFALEEGDVFRTETAWHERAPEASHAPGEDATPPITGPWEALLNAAGPVVKLLAAHATEDPDALHERAALIVGDRAEVTHSVTPGCTTLLEISARGVSKASAVARIAATRGVPAARVAAFGDMPNDTALLEYAGHPYVMANGHASLRSRFPVIGDHDEAAVGAQIRRILAERAQA